MPETVLVPGVAWPYPTTFTPLTRPPVRNPRTGITAYVLQVIKERGPMATTEIHHHLEYPFNNGKGVSGAMFTLYRGGYVQRTGTPKKYVYSWAKGPETLTAPRRFNDEEVAQIRAERAAGLKYEALIAKYQTSTATLASVIYGKDAYKELTT